MSRIPDWDLYVRISTIAMNLGAKLSIVSDLYSPIVPVCYGIFSLFRGANHEL